jgi:hypothetical protein
MGKAKANHTPEQPPLDDDTQWMSLLDAFLLRFEQLHEVTLVKLALEEVNLVELDVDQALAGGELPCMRRNLVTGERERVLPPFWEANQAKCVNFPEHGWHAGIYPRREQRWGGWNHRDDDHTYFVLKADYAKRWPTAVPQPQPDRDKPGERRESRACQRGAVNRLPRWRASRYQVQGRSGAGRSRVQEAREGAP